MVPIVKHVYSQEKGMLNGCQTSCQLGYLSELLSQIGRIQKQICGLSKMFHGSSRTQFRSQRHHEGILPSIQVSNVHLPNRMVRYPRCNTHHIDQAYLACL